MKDSYLKMGDADGQSGKSFQDDVARDHVLGQRLCGAYLLGNSVGDACKEPVV